MDDTERSVFNIVATFHSTEDATKAEAPVIKKVSEFCRQYVTFSDVKKATKQKHCKSLFIV